MPAIADIDLDTEQVLALAPDLEGYTITITPDSPYETQVELSTYSRDRGTRMQITGWGGGATAESSAHTAAATIIPRTGGQQHRTQWIAGALRVVLIEGVYDAEIAYRTLVDTIRADKVHRRLVRERTDRASEYLRQARADYDALDAAAQFTSGRARLLAAAERVARWEGVPSSVFQAHARLDDTDAAALERALAEHPGFTPLYLDIPAVAERIGVDPATMRSYKSRGMMPPPGMEVSDRPAWEWDVIERWVKDRRGQAWAAGTTADEAGRRS